MVEEHLFKSEDTLGGTGEHAGEGCADTEHSEANDDGTGETV